MTIRAVQLFTSITAIILLTGVWVFKQNEIALFASTILTALGIAFFAQWSLPSNITSSILIPWGTSAAVPVPLIRPSAT